MDEREQNPVRYEAVVRAHAWCVRLWQERKISAEFTSADEAELVEMMCGFLTLFPPPVANEQMANLQKRLDFAIRGNQVRDEILERKTAEFRERLRSEEAKYQRTLSLQDDEVAEFNAGYEAAVNGVPLECEPDDLPFDVWTHGWKSADHKRLSAEAADLRRQLEKAWIPVANTVPANQVVVLAVTRPEHNPENKRTIIRAWHTEAMHVEQSYVDYEGDDLDYDESIDGYYLPEGWYEVCEADNSFWRVSDIVTHWLPLPDMPQAE